MAGPAGVASSFWREKSVQKSNVAGLGEVMTMGCYFCTLAVPVMRPEASR